MSRLGEGRSWGYNVEDMLECSGDGLESRVVAKDFLYKLEGVLKSERGRGFGLKDRLGLHIKDSFNNGVPLRLRHRVKGKIRKKKRKCSVPITYAVKKRAKELWQQV